jgi:hypothetical protein
VFSLPVSSCFRKAFGYDQRIITAYLPESFSSLEQSRRLYSF